MLKFKALLVASALIYCGAASAAPGGDPISNTLTDPNFDDVTGGQIQIERILSDTRLSQISDAQADVILYQGDLWARIRSGFVLPDTAIPTVYTQIQKFAATPRGIERSSERASKYLYHVVEQIERRKMPMELALLPFVESSFDPQAYSGANASGMWQFIPSTGLQYNLKQNLFKDERRDVIASTDAALNYLERLYETFGDWPLALAAYNWGEGSVTKAIKRNQAAGLPTDFDSLAPYMPEETRNYVPKLLAMKEIISNPTKYGVKLPNLKNKPYFTSVQKTRDIDVKVAAELAEIPVKEFKELNPQFNKAVITGNSNTSILLPTSKVERFQRNLVTWGKALSLWTSHSVIGAREKIASIAHRFGTTPEIIREANNIPARMEVAAGSTLLVPKISASSGSEFTADISELSKVALRAPQPEPKAHHGRYQKAPKSKEKRPSKHK